MATQTKDSYYLSLRRDDARHKWQSLIKEFPEQLVDRPMTKVELEHAQRANPEIPTDLEEIHDLAFGAHKDFIKMHPQKNEGRKGGFREAYSSHELSEEEKEKLAPLRGEVQAGNNPEFVPAGELSVEEREKLSTVKAKAGEKATKEKERIEEIDAQLSQKRGALLSSLEAQARGKATKRQEEETIDSQQENGLNAVRKKQLSQSEDELQREYKVLRGNLEQELIQKKRAELTEYYQGLLAGGELKGGEAEVARMVNEGVRGYTFGNHGTRGQINPWGDAIRTQIDDDLDAIFQKKTGARWRGLVDKKAEAGTAARDMYAPAHALIPASAVEDKRRLLFGEEALENDRQLGEIEQRRALRSEEEARDQQSFYEQKEQIEEEIRRLRDAQIAEMSYPVAGASGLQGKLAVPLYESPASRISVPRASQEDVDSFNEGSHSPQAPSYSSTSDEGDFMPSRPRAPRRPSLRHRRKTRGMLEKLFRFDSRRIVQQAAMNAGRFLFSTPTGWVVLGVIFIFCVIVYMVVLRPSFSGPEGSQIGQPGAPVPGQPAPGAPIPGLEIRTSGPSYVSLGASSATYEIRVEYSGPLDVMVFANIPSGTTYIGSSPEGKFDSANNAIQWNLRSLSSEDGSYTLIVHLRPSVGIRQITFKASAVAGPQTPSIGN